ncbi:MAG: hypothetical protein QOG80_1455 [Pseudonocardiales bacterium]|nr:hypothetical protein [Pseudonocardiales bacterium]
MLVVSRTEVRDLLDLDGLRVAVGAAMAEVSSGSVSMPTRTAAFVAERDAMLAVMPAYLPGAGVLASKLVSLFPLNAGTGLPTHQAVIVVFDAASGRPEALVDGTEITAARTAAGSALAIDLLAAPTVRVLAILGTGVQAAAHAVAVTRVRPFERVMIAGRTPEHSDRLVAELSALPTMPVAAAATVEEACGGADVVCATTHSAEPVVHRAALRDAAIVTSVGYNTQGREVDADTVADAFLVVESRAAALAPAPSGSNDLRVPLAEGRITAEHIHEVGELVNGSVTIPPPGTRLVLYKSVGIAAQDLAAVQLVLEAARATGRGTTINL